MRHHHRALSLALGVTIVLAAGPAAAAEGDVTVRRLDAKDFPNVELVVSTRGEVSEADISVTENGQAVEDFEVRDLSSAGVSVDVVLVIDTSGSMIGPPMAATIRAATAFVEKVPDDVRVGVVAFSDQPRVLSPLTTDHASILGPIQNLEAAGETALYDATVMGAELFEGSAQRNMVLLSDGGDTASKAGLGDALKAVKGARATVFPVGLETPETAVSVLRRVAVRSGGRYAPAAEADLSGIYSGLAEELTGQFIVAYRSTAEAGVQTTVGVETADGLDSSLFLPPEIEPVGDGGAPAVEAEEPGWTPGLPLVLLVAFLALAFMMQTAFSRRGSSKRRRRLQEQILAEPIEDELETGERAGLAAWVPGAVSGAAEEMAKDTALFTRVDRALDRAGLKLKVGELIGGIAWIGLLCVVGGAILFDGFLLITLITVIGMSIPVFWVLRKGSRRTAQINKQLTDVLMILASSLRAGHSFLQALDLVAKEIGPPASHEFNRAVAEVRLGRTTDEALNDLALRVGSEDFQWAVMAANIQRGVGGNLAEVLESVATTMRERQALRRQIDVLAAEGKLSGRLLTGLPFFLGLYLYFVNKEAIMLLFTTQLGLTFVVGGLVLLLAGSIWMRRLVRIDV